MRNSAPTFGINEAGRDFVVGDVHGCFRTLERALGALEFDPEGDRLFGVGALVNRGPHSVEAIDWLERRFEAVTMGNHDRLVLRWLQANPRSALPAQTVWLTDVPRREFPRWRAALASMPIALAIETPHGAVGVVHAEPPHRSWSESLRLIETGDILVVDDTLLGFALPAEIVCQRHSHPVEALRALVHGHVPVREVECTGNRWDIDTGAGIARFNRLTVLELNGPEFLAWTFAVHESLCGYPAGTNSSCTCC